MKMSIIVPACNEEAHIEGCILSLLDQDFGAALAGQVEVIFAANACRDRTVEIIKSYQDGFAAKGVPLTVLDLEEGGKTNAMNAADTMATGEMRCYMDADITGDPDLFAQIHQILSVPEPRYASGMMIVSRAKSFVTRACAAVWSELPFMKDSVPGAGLFCVNPAGRARWGAFPSTFADDVYVRLLFKPKERFATNARFYWPMAEGFYDLSRVRARQNAHAADIHSRYPELLENEDAGFPSPTRLASIFLRMPVKFVVYVLVMLNVKFGVARDLRFRTGPRSVQG